MRGRELMRGREGKGGERELSQGRERVSSGEYGRQRALTLLFCSFPLRSSSTDGLAAGGERARRVGVPRGGWLRLPPGRGRQRPTFCVSTACLLFLYPLEIFPSLSLSFRDDDRLF